jgi:hypothetical protein
MRLVSAPNSNGWNIPLRSHHIHTSSSTYSTEPHEDCSEVKHQTQMSNAKCTSTGICVTEWSVAFFVLIRDYSYTQIYEHTDSPIILEPGSCIFDPVSAHTRIQDVRKGGLSLVRLPLLWGFPHIDSPAPAEAQLATTTDCLHYSKTGGRWGGSPPPASSPEGDSSSTLRRMGWEGFHVYIPRRSK